MLSKETARAQREATEREVDQKQLELLRTDAAEVPELRERTERLDSEVAVLRAQLEAPIYSSEQLLDALHRHLAIVEMVKKHRAICEDGGRELPVTSASEGPEGMVRLRALAGDAADRYSGEAVQLWQAGGPASGTAPVLGSSGIGDVFIDLPPEDVPEEILEGVAQHNVYNPPGYVARLVGLDWEPFCSLSPETLERLAEKLSQTQTAISQTMSQHHDGSVPGS